MQRMPENNLECFDCGASFPFFQAAYTCPSCGGNLFYKYCYDQLAAGFLKELSRSAFPSERPLLRYASLLPDLQPEAVRLRVGGTPLYAAGNALGCDLYFKDETRNPSGSLKDRASAVVVGAAMASGFDKVAVASTGNAASSLACLGASIGLDITVFVPSEISPEKLCQIQLFGATVRQIDGSYDDAYDVCQEFCRANPSYFNRNTGFNPATREGKKTCAFEIWEQLGREVPSWVAVAVGDGNTISGLWKGFLELRRLGLADRTPRMLAVQSCQSDAVVRLLHHGPEALKPAETKAGGIAESIRVARPRDGTAAVRAIRESSGQAAEVSDAEMLTAIRELARTWGLFVEPAAAASYAAVKLLADRRELKPTDTVVSVLTGTGLKDMQSARLAIAAGSS